MTKVGSSEWWSAFAEDLGEDLSDSYKNEVNQFLDRIDQHTIEAGRREQTDWRDPINALKQMLSEDDEPEDTSDSAAVRWKVLTAKMSEQVRGIADSLYPLNPISHHKGSFLPVRFGELRKLVSGESFGTEVVVIDKGDSTEVSGGDRLEKDDVNKINKSLRDEDKKEVEWVTAEPTAIKFFYPPQPKRVDYADGPGGEEEHKLALRKWKDVNSFKLAEEELTEGKQIYLGFPKIGFTFKKSYNERLALIHQKGKNKKAAFPSIEVDSIDLSDNILTIYFKEENVQEIKKEWNTHVSIPLTDSSMDSYKILIGRYVDLEEADLDGYLANLKAGISLHGSNTVSNMLNGIGDSIAASIDSLATREFYCCIFYELIRNAKVKGATSDVNIYKVDSGNNIITRGRYSSDAEYQEAFNAGTPVTLDDILENPRLATQHIEIFLEEQRIWLRQLRAVLSAMLPLFRGNSISLNWEAGCFNVVAIMHTSVTIMLTTMLNITQEHLYEQAIQWGKERIEASQNKSVVNRCLPWEELFMGMITALFGPNGWAKEVRELISRMQEYMLNKSKEIALDSEKGTSSMLDHPWLPRLNATLDIIDWLIDLNAQAFMICATHRPDKFESNNGAASSSNETITQTGGGDGAEDETNRREETGAMDDSSSNAGRTSGTSDGSKDGSLYTSAAGLTRQIDITGEEINPVSLLMEHKDEDVAKFFTQYMGLTEQEANEALSKAKKGECVKALGTDEVQELKNALNNVGLEL